MVRGATTGFYYSRLPDRWKMYFRELFSIIISLSKMFGKNKKGTASGFRTLFGSRLGPGSHIQNGVSTYE